MGRPVAGNRGRCSESRRHRGRRIPGRIAALAGENVSHENPEQESLHAQGKLRNHLV